MFENDYLMRMILQLAEAIRKSLMKGHKDVYSELHDIERAIGDAVDMDPQLLLSLAPESVVSMLQLGSFDEQLGGFVVRALFYEAGLLEEQNRFGTADLRRAQANAIAQAYSIDVSIADASPEALEEFVKQWDAQHDTNYRSDEDSTALGFLG